MFSRVHGINICRCWSVLVVLGSLAVVVPQAGSAQPIGSVQAFAGPKDHIPSGWRECNGDTIRRSRFPALFRVIGISWGEGNGRTTFNLPDLRGVFLRGVAGTSNLDPDVLLRERIRPGGNTGNAVGSLQQFGTALPRKTPFSTGNENQQHQHDYFDAHFAEVHAGADQRLEGSNNGFDGDNGAFGRTRKTAPNTVSHTHEVTAGGDGETRPVNAYVYWICRVS